MNHIMFDVDGTLVQSYDFDEQCFLDAVSDVTGIEILNNWSTYPHVTDTGILQTFIERQASHLSIGELEKDVKSRFIVKLHSYLADSPAMEVEGAINCFEQLKSNENVVLSIATGGWGDTAQAKLESAGFNIDGVPIASSNDHYSRIEIMNIAKAKANNSLEFPLTYFGDAEWDVRACKELGVNLVIVGNRVQHYQSLPDLSNIKEVMDYVYLAANM
jgi:phosphoglycolate phosphatase-like HAD superfamily hydrolase